MPRRHEFLLPPRYGQELEVLTKAPVGVFIHEKRAYEVSRSLWREGMWSSLTYGATMSIQLWPFSQQFHTTVGHIEPALNPLVPSARLSSNKRPSHKPLVISLPPEGDSNLSLAFPADLKQV